MLKQPCVYIMANKRNGTIYTGVTADLIKRVYQHKEGAVVGFTKNTFVKFLYGMSSTVQWKLLLCGKNKLRAEVEKRSWS